MKLFHTTTREEAELSLLSVNDYCLIKEASPEIVENTEEKYYKFSVVIDDKFRGHRDICKIQMSSQDFMAGYWEYEKRNKEKLINLGREQERQFQADFDLAKKVNKLLDKGDYSKLLEEIF